MSADLLNLVRGRTHTIRAELSKQLACVDICAPAIRKVLDAAPASFKFSESELNGYLQQIHSIQRLDYIRAHSVLCGLANARKTIAADYTRTVEFLEKEILSMNLECSTLERRFEDQRKAAERYLESEINKASEASKSSEYVSMPDSERFHGIAMWLAMAAALYIVGKQFSWDASDLNKLIGSVIGLIGYAIQLFVLGWCLFFTFTFLFWAISALAVLCRRSSNSNSAKSEARKIGTYAESEYQRVMSSLQSAEKEQTVLLDSKVFEKTRILNLTKEALDCVEKRWPQAA